MAALLLLPPLIPQLPVLNSILSLEIKFPISFLSATR
jgi:hypothetical protein